MILILFKNFWCFFNLVMIILNFWKYVIKKYINKILICLFIKILLLKESRKRVSLFFRENKITLEKINLMEKELNLNLSLYRNKLFSKNRKTLKKKI